MHFITNDPCVNDYTELDTRSRFETSLHGDFTSRTGITVPAISAPWIVGDAVSDQRGNIRLILTRL